MIDGWATTAVSTGIVLEGRRRGAAVASVSATRGICIRGGTPGGGLKEPLERVLQQPGEDGILRTHRRPRQGVQLLAILLLASRVVLAGRLARKPVKTRQGLVFQIGVSSKEFTVPRRHGRGTRGRWGRSRSTLRSFGGGSRRGRGILALGRADRDSRRLGCPTRSAIEHAGHIVLVTVDGKIHPQTVIQRHLRRR